MPTPLEELEERVKRLEAVAHPPVNLTPAMIDILQGVGLMCSRPIAGWWCSRGPSHKGACAARKIEAD